MKTLFPDSCTMYTGYQTVLGTYTLSLGVDQCTVFWSFLNRKKMALLMNQMRALEFLLVLVMDYCLETVPIAFRTFLKLIRMFLSLDRPTETSPS